MALMVPCVLSCRTKQSSVPLPATAPHPLLCTAPTLLEHLLLASPAPCGLTSFLRNQFTPLHGTATMEGKENTETQSKCLLTFRLSPLPQDQVFPPSLVMLLHSMLQCARPGGGFCRGQLPVWRGRRRVQHFEWQPVTAAEPVCDGGSRERIWETEGGAGQGPKGRTDTHTQSLVLMVLSWKIRI